MKVMIFSVIKAILCSILGVGIVFGISGCSEKNVTVMKFGIWADVDGKFDRSYLFELKENRVLYVTKGGGLRPQKDFFNSKKDGSIGFDSLEWDEEWTSEEGSVELSEEQYVQIIDICDDIKALGPWDRIGSLGITAMYILYDGNVYVSKYVLPEEVDNPNTPAEHFELCDLLIEFSPIVVTKLSVEPD